MEEKYKKFLEFKWHESADWQLYYSNLSQIPAPDKVEHFKKRFYKLKIDSDFDTKWTAPQAQNQTGGTTSGPSSSSYTYPSAPTGASINSPLLEALEASLWFAFLLSILFLPHYSLRITCMALLMRVLRRIGMPKFNIEYAQVLFLDEHFQMLLYAVLLMIDSFNYFTVVTLALTAVLNISEYVKSKPAMFAVVLPYANKVLNKRVVLAQMRANVEIAIGFLLIIGIFFGINSFVLPIFYWQYLRFKYIVNNDLKISFGRLNYFISDFKSRPSVPAPVKYVLTKIQDFATYLGRTEPAPGQAAGGANCLIF